MKLQLHKKNIVFICLLLLSSLIAHATDKVVSITGDATHSGTYVYQGTRTSTSGCGTSRTYKYYKLSGTNYYLYADYDNMGCTDDWFGWYICNGLIARPGQASGHEFIYNGYMSDYSLVPDNPSGCNAWINLAGGNVTSNFSITDAASGVAPTVSTLEASLVTTTSGTIGGNVLADGGATVTARGLVFSPSSNTNPQIGGTNVTQYTEGTGTGSYTQLVSPLTAGATYYYQAYGTNSYGTTYGGVKSFTTPTTSQPNKLVSGITSPSTANGIYVWIGNYYGKPAWKHQTLNYWVYYSIYTPVPPFDTQYYWFIDNELKNSHGTNDFYYRHADAVTCPASGWNAFEGAGTVAIADYPNISFTNGASFSPGNPMANTTNKPIGRFYLSGELAGASLTAVTINASGTRSGVSNLKLWSSSSATFSTGSANQLNSQSDGSTVTFSGFTSSISTSGTYYFITTDLAATASGSFTLTIGSQANLTISGGAIASSFSNAALTSGAITIIGFPTLSTAAASSIATTSATLGGTVTADGGATVSDRGIVYSSTNTNPTIGGTGVIQDANGSGTGPFNKSVGSLAQGTIYYFNAYATNTAGTSYGTATSFTTQNTVSSIVRVGSTPTNATSVQWTVSFAASLAGLTASNFSLVNTGLTTPSITNVTGSGTTWTVTANTGSGSGTLGLNLVNSSGLSSTLSNTTFTGQVYTIDKTAPTISSVSSSTANGTYKTGDAIIITATFSETVTVTGTPTLALNSGGTASYTSGSGTSTLIFTYTVGTGNSSTDLDYSATNSLSLSGGTINDAVGNAATLALPAVGGAGSLGGQKSIVVDGIAPTINNVSVPANGIYSTGQALNFTVVFSEAVTVITTGGIPYLTLTVGSTTVYANYVSGSGTTNLLFSYTVASGNLDTDGITLGSNVTLNSGTIMDGAGNNAALVFTGSSLSGVLVNVVVPALTTTTASNITSTSATLGGEVTANGGASVTERGVVYSSTNTTPTISGTAVTQDANGSGTGSFSKSITSLTPGITYYFQSYAINIAGTSYGGVQSFTTSTPIWNGTAWSYSTPPTSADNAILDGDYNAAGFTCNNLTVNAGKQVTVTSGTLAVNGNLTLKSDITNGTATLIGTITVGGTTSVEQYLTGGTGVSDRQWWYLSSPVTGATSGVFSPSGVNNLGYYNETATPPAFVPIAGDAEALVAGRGYLAQLKSTGTYVFTGGTLNSGDIRINVTRTGTTAAKRGFNLIGNPYPSYLDWNQLLATAESSNVRPTIWYRTVNSSGVLIFETFSGTTGTNIGGLGAVTQYIPPVQAVWMKVNTDNSSDYITFKNEMRSHKGAGYNPLRVPAVSQKQIVRLKVSNGFNNDETILVANENASDGYDNFDAPKMSNDNIIIPEIYTLANTEELVINNLNTISSGKELVLGFRPGQASNFTIEATEISNLDADIKVILLDKLTNTEQELKVGIPYNFSSDATATNDRFSIRFKSASAPTGMNNPANIQDVLVYRNPNNRITVIYNAGISSIQSLVSVYNDVGQKLATQKLTNTTTEITGAFIPGIYLVTVNNGEQSITKKVIIK